LKKLTPLPATPSYVDRFKGIRDNKREPTKGTLAAKHSDISKQYTKYQSAIAANNLESLKPSPSCAAIADELRSCYDGATNALRALKKEIKAAQPKRLLKYCPMCGTTLPSTFDHYLPASKFPEFAVLGANLIPCCSLCNSRKDDDWLNPSGDRQYICAYLDEIPDEDFLVVTLHHSKDLDAVGAVFSYNKPNHLANPQWALLDSHFRKLKLIERFNELGNEEVSEILEDCQTFVEEKGKNVRKFL